MLGLEIQSYYKIDDFDKLSDVYQILIKKLQNIGFKCSDLKKYFDNLHLLKEDEEIYTQYLKNEILFPTINYNYEQIYLEISLSVQGHLLVNINNKKELFLIVSFSFPEEEIFITENNLYSDSIYKNEYANLILDFMKKLYLELGTSGVYLTNLMQNCEPLEYILNKRNDLDISELMIIPNDIIRKESINKTSKDKYILKYDDYSIIYDKIFFQESIFI